MAVTVTGPIAGSGTYTKVFTVTALLADAAADSAATAHGLPGTPTSVSVCDTSGAADENPAALGNCWVVHTIGATTFVVRKTVATTQNRSCRVTLKIDHSMM